MLLYVKDQESQNMLSKDLFGFLIVRKTIVFYLSIVYVENLMTRHKCWVNIQPRFQETIKKFGVA